MNDYPQFYCKEGHCLKRGSDTTTMEIRIPLENDTVPLCYHPVTYPSKARLDEQVGQMNRVNMETYESYLSDFLKGVRKVDQNFSQYRDQKIGRGVAV